VDILCLAVIAGAAAWEDVEAFGRDKYPWLTKCMGLPNGFPKYDTMPRLSHDQPSRFRGGGSGTVDVLHIKIGTRQTAIHGKTLRRSYDCGEKKSMLHMVSSWSVANHAVLGDQSVDDKSNECTAIPQLLELKGATVRIDNDGLPSRHCQGDRSRSRELYPGGQGQSRHAARRHRPAFRVRCGAQPTGPARLARCPKTITKNGITTSAHCRTGLSARHNQSWRRR
jgi:hypothetical protein